MVYLINKETNEIVQSFENVLEWSENFVEYSDGKYRGKTYCDLDTEYFTDVAPNNEEVTQ